MKILRLFLTAFGPFTDREVVLSPAGQSLTVVYGPNETGKSCTLRAITDLRFGIPQQSHDNFVHPYTEMRIGALMQDTDLGEQLVVRRKGRGSTLYAVDSPHAELTPAHAVPSGFETQLTGGLSRDEYEIMYGLDHERLRSGGQALLKGHGEVGAALFEASAGVRNVKQLLDRLEHSARELFLPGSRARNARINQAIATYNTQQTILREALVRPRHWASLHRKHEETKEHVARLEQRREELNRRLNQIHELRAVAPLIGTLDAAQAALAELSDAPVLPDSAATERAAAITGLDEANRNIAIAKQEYDAARERYEQCQPDQKVLQLAPAISRLVAAAESYSQTQLERANAENDVTRETDYCIALAQDIDPDGNPQAIIQSIPSASTRAAIEHHLRSLESAQQSLEQTRAALQRLQDDPQQRELPALPSADARAALRIALVACDRNNQHVQALQSLPTQIDQTQRDIRRGLANLRLPNEDALLMAQPLLRARIDQEITHRNRLTTQLEERQARLAQIHAEEEQTQARRDELLAGGEVPTWDDVRDLRAQRDTWWTTLRRLLAEDSSQLGASTIQAHVPHFEQAMQSADTAVDMLARDSERAAQLQTCNLELTRIKETRAKTQAEIHALERELEACEKTWKDTLSHSGLPLLSPTELRDWQEQLAAVQATHMHLEALRQQLEQSIAVTTELSEQLRQALLNTGHGALSADLSFETLIATAQEHQDALRRLEDATNAAAGELAERKRQRKELEQTRMRAEEMVKQAERALAPLLAPLRLTSTAQPSVIRARLAEYEALEKAHERAQTARDRLNKTTRILQLYQHNAAEIARQLGDALPSDIRLYVDDLATRLEHNKHVDSERERFHQIMAAADTSRRRHEEVARTHAEALERLCHAAGVATPDELPAAEERAKRRQQAQLQLDHARRQLAEVSSRSLDELRALLRDRDTASFEAEEAAYQEQRKQLDEDLEQARELEQAARQDLRAVDSSDTAAAAHEAIVQATARIETNVRPWMRVRLAHALLGEALQRFRERAQAPMLRAAEHYFRQMTDGEFVRLSSDDTDDQPVLLAERSSGTHIHVEAMSEGTRDQLFLALRLAALELRRQAGVDLPVVLDDVLMTSDDRRAGLMLQALAKFSEGRQVIVFTHHQHLLEVAEQHVDAGVLHTVEL